MPTRQFNGHEINFLMGMSNDDHSRIEDRKPLGSNDDGYEQEEVVVRHPDGKLYQFVWESCSEHGIYPTCERPDEVIVAVEVERVQVKVFSYEPV